MCILTIILLKNYILFLKTKSYIKGIRLYLSIFKTLGLNLIFTFYKQNFDYFLNVKHLKNKFCVESFFDFFGLFAIIVDVPLSLCKIS